MPGKTYEQMVSLRKWIALALKSGAANPRQVMEYLETHADDLSQPSLTTVISIMRGMGYEPVSHWERTKEKG